MRLRFLLASLAAIVALFQFSVAFAQTYPDRAVKIVVPLGTGGSYDFVGRLLAAQLTKRMGQSFVVENIPGSGTVIGTRAVTSATPDGHTLLVGGLANIAFNPALYKNLPYNPQTDLVPVALIYQFSYILIANKDLPFNSAKDIIAAAKQKPESIKVAHAGLGTGQHVTALAFMNYTGTKMLEVPYKGSSTIFPDLISGRVDLYFDSAASAMPFIKSGQVKPIATLTARRMPAAPGIPTMTEEGVPNLEVESWIGIFAPAKTPAPVIARLQKEIAASLPDMKERFETSGGAVMDLPPSQLLGFVKKEQDKWTQLIRSAGISLD
jgi:tripartite-type tricarboxylate transporter receptor subunit TctC